MPTQKGGAAVSRLLGVLIGLVLLLGAAGSASAATLYVTPSGSATSVCASVEPCSASRADAIVAPGDTVQVAPGGYGPLTLTRGGTDVAPVTWSSGTRWGAHAPTIARDRLHLNDGVAERARPQLTWQRGVGGDHPPDGGEVGRRRVRAEPPPEADERIEHVPRIV